MPLRRPHPALAGRNSLTRLGLHSARCDAGGGIAALSLTLSTEQLTTDN